jgi:hypothetical protein
VLPNSTIAEVAETPMSDSAYAICRVCATILNEEKEKIMAKKTSGSSTKGQRKIHKVMKEKKEGTLKSGSGKKVTSRKQAVAIALSEARKSGAKIPKKKKS